MRLINLYVSVTHETCFQLSGGKNSKCPHVRDMSGYSGADKVYGVANFKVNVECTTCNRNAMTKYYWNKTKSKYRFEEYAEKHTKAPMFKFAVPPGKYKISCEKTDYAYRTVYLKPSVPQKRFERNYLDPKDQVQF